jgi:uncharacterized protein
MWSILPLTEFEYDPERSLANKLKHGIDFDEARELLARSGPRLRARYRGAEARLVAIGKIGDKVWTAVFTWRGDRVRIIAVGRARKNEAQRYEEDWRQ